MLVLFLQLDGSSLKGRDVLLCISIISVPKHKVIDQVVDGLKEDWAKTQKPRSESHLCPRRTLQSWICLLTTIGVMWDGDAEAFSHHTLRVTPWLRQQDGQKQALQAMWHDTKWKELILLYFFCQTEDTYSGLEYAQGKLVTMKFIHLEVQTFPKEVHMWLRKYSVAQNLC